MIFKSLGNRSLLSKTVEEEIENAIRQKKLVPGTKLPTEMELCTQFGVSRTVVREAVRVLHAKGMISIEKGRGMYVQNFTGESAADPLHMYLQMNFDRTYVMDIVKARQMLEPSIAGLAARNRSAEDLKLLAADIEALRTCAGGFEELAKIDTQFHLNVAKASRNSLMPLLLEPIHRLIPEIKSKVYATIEEAKDSAVVWHQRILDQIAARKPAAAEKAMAEHLRIAEAHAKRMLTARGAKQNSRKAS